MSTNCSFTAKISTYYVLIPLEQPSQKPDQMCPGHFDREFFPEAYIKAKSNSSTSVANKLLPDSTGSSMVDLL